MNRKKHTALCLFTCLLLLSPVFFCGLIQKTHASNESAFSSDEVQDPEEVRRAVVSKPYNQTIEEARSQGKSQMQTDLDMIKRKTAEVWPEWLTKKVVISLGTVLFLCAIAVRMIKTLRRHEKKKAMKELHNIQEERQKYR